MLLDEPLPNLREDNPLAKEKLQSWCFLKYTYGKPDCEGQNGSSWIKLFAAFQIMGWQGHEVDISQEEAVTPNFRQQLLFFIKTMRQVVQFHCTSLDALLFKLTRCSTHRLADYGIQHHVPCITAELCLAPAMATQVHNCMASFRKKTQHQSQETASKRTAASERR